MKLNSLIVEYLDAYLITDLRSLVASYHYDFKSLLYETLRGHTNWVTCVTVLPNGKLARNCKCDSEPRSGNPDLEIKQFEFGIRSLKKARLDDMFNGSSRWQLGFWI